MKIKKKIIPPSTIAITFILAVLSNNSAYAANLNRWNIYFYDQFDNQVGQGQFAYQSGNPTFINTCDNFECISTDEGFYIDNVLESWNAEIQVQNLLSGQTSIRAWNAQDFSSANNIRWWKPQTSTVESAFYGDRYGLFDGIQEAWVMRPTYIDFIGFEMRGTSGKATSSWRQYYPIELSPESGYWVAEPVPEPTSFFGIGTAITFGIFMKRQVNKYKKSKISKHSGHDV